MFELSLDVKNPNDSNKTIKNRRDEGVRLTQVTPIEKKNQIDKLFQLIS